MCTCSEVILSGVVGMSMCLLTMYRRSTWTVLDGKSSGHLPHNRDDNCIGEVLGWPLEGRSSGHLYMQMPVATRIVSQLLHLAITLRNVLLY